MKGEPWNSQKGQEDSWDGGGAYFPLVRVLSRLSLQTLHFCLPLISPLRTLLLLLNQAGICKSLNNWEGREVRQDVGTRKQGYKMACIEGLTERIWSGWAVSRNAGVAGDDDTQTERLLRKGDRAMGSHSGDRQWDWVWSWTFLKCQLYNHGNWTTDYWHQGPRQQKPQWRGAQESILPKTGRCTSWLCMPEQRTHSPASEFPRGGQFLVCSRHRALCAT